MAIQSALTWAPGFFNFAYQIHAASAVTRLLESGIEPFLVSSSVIGVLAQRLVRQICVHCKSSVTNDSGNWKFRFRLQERAV